MKSHQTTVCLLGAIVAFILGATIRRAGAGPSLDVSYFNLPLPAEPSWTGLTVGFSYRYTDGVLNANGTFTAQRQDDVSRGDGNRDTNYYGARQTYAYIKWAEGGYILRSGNVAEVNRAYFGVEQRTFNNTVYVKVTPLGSDDSTASGSTDPLVASAESSLENVSFSTLSGLPRTRFAAFLGALGRQFAAEGMPALQARLGAVAGLLVSLKDRASKLRAQVRRGGRASAKATREIKRLVRSLNIARAMTALSSDPYVTAALERLFADANKGLKNALAGRPFSKGIAVVNYPGSQLFKPPLTAPSEAWDLGGTRYGSDRREIYLPLKNFVNLYPSMGLNSIYRGRLFVSWEIQQNSALSFSVQSSSLPLESSVFQPFAVNVLTGSLVGTIVLQGSSNGAWFYCQLDSVLRPSGTESKFKRLTVRVLPQ